MVEKWLTIQVSHIMFLFHLSHGIPTGVFLSMNENTKIIIPLVVFLGPKTFVVIAGEPKTLRVTQLIKKAIYDIATPQWLIRALGSDEPLTHLIKLTPGDIVFATDKLKEQFDAEADIYDECDTEPMEYEENEGANRPEQIGDCTEEPGQVQPEIEAEQL